MHHIMNPSYVGDKDYENLLTAFIKDYGIHKGGLPDRDPKGKSMWLLKDGSVIDLGQLYHMMAYKKLLADHKLNPITNGHEPSEYDDEDYFTPDSSELYRNFGVGTGAIRLYHNGYPGSTSHMYCEISYPPTSEQMQILKQIGNFYEGTYSDWSSNTNFTFKTYAELESRLNQKGLIDSYPNRKKEEINEPQKPKQPTENRMQSFIKNVDKEPIIPSLERKRLFENYPGDENAKLRSLYEKSASIKTSQNTLLPPIHDNCRCHIDTLPGGRKIWQFANNCCQQCKDLAFVFNKNQSEVFDNQPAVMPSPKPNGEISPANPPTPYEQPATVPIITPEDQITNEYLYPKRLFNRFRFK